MEILIPRVSMFPRPVTSHLREALQMSNVCISVVCKCWSTMRDLRQGEDDVEEVSLQVHFEELEVNY
jgi:hypothetical protein